MLDGQQLRGNFLLALGLIAQEGFQLLFGLAGLFSVFFFAQHALLLQTVKFLLPGI